MDLQTALARIAELEEERAELLDELDSAYREAYGYPYRDEEPPAPREPLDPNHPMCDILKILERDDTPFLNYVNTSNPGGNTITWTMSTLERTEWKDPE